MHSGRAGAGQREGTQGEINSKQLSPQDRCGQSQRRACGLVGVARSTLGYELRLAAKDVPVIETMKSLPAQYQRCGYRFDRSSQTYRSILAIGPCAEDRPAEGKAMLAAGSDLLMGNCLPTDKHTSLGHLLSTELLA